MHCDVRKGTHDTVLMQTLKYKQSVATLYTFIIAISQTLSNAHVDNNLSNLSTTVLHEGINSRINSFNERTIDTPYSPAEIL